MSLKDRTRKRLRWFLIGTVLLGCLGVAAYFVRDRHLESRAVASRDAGLKFLEQKDYFQALHSIGPYVRRHPDDADALFAYAKARREVPEPNNRHINDTVGLLRRVVTLSPGNIKAKQTLLDLYREHGLMTEALQLSQDVLATDAKNEVAMKARAVALASGAKAANSKPDDALQASKSYNDLRPDDVDGQLLTMELLNRGDSKREAAVAHFAKLREESPKDPLRILLLGVAHLSSGDTAAGKKLVAEAAELEMPNAPAVQLLVRSCDQLGLFTDSLDVLKRHAALATDQKFVALFAGRLWELDRHQELATQFDGTVGNDPQVAALRCLALNELGQTAQARAALDALKKAASSNPSARDWADVIEPLLASATPDDAAVIDACQKALRGRNNPYLRFILADAYNRAGEQDAAIQSWTQVNQLAPAWSAPLMRLAQVVASHGDGEQTLSLAEEALNRAPDNTRAMVLLASARTAKLKVEPAGFDKAFELLDRIAKLAPENTAVLPLRVRALALVGRTQDAVTEARRALDPAKPASAETLIALATVSAELKLGLEQELLDQCERTHGTSLHLAMFKAKKELDAGRKAEAVQLIEKARAAATTNKLEWDTTWARVLETTADPRAKDAWVALADANPANAHAQWACLGSSPVQGDRAARRRVLDRLKERYGDRGLRWRLAHAQWLFDGRKENPQNLAEAALVLNELTRDVPQLVPAKLLLADCQFELKQIPGAISQLTSAAALQPQSSEILLKLAKALHLNGDATRSRPYLDAIVALRVAPFDHVREAAAIIDAQGDAAAALAALEKAYGAGLKDPPADLLLANLYRKTNQPQRAEGILKSLLKLPNANTINFAAEFYASQGRSAEAADVLKRLDQLETAPGEKEVIRGSHALRAGDTTQALSQFTEATRVAPDKSIAWRQLIRIYLRRQDHEKALSTARMAQAAVANDRGFAAFVRQAPHVLKAQAQWPQVAGVWGDLLNAPDVEKALTEVIGLLPENPKTPMQTRPLNRLIALAGEQPQVLALQFLAARACALAGRAEDAARIASRAARSAAADPEPAQFAVLALAEAGRWSEVLEMAGQWRRATPGDTIGPDQMIAAAHMALGNFAAARDQLTPHLTKALAEPEKFSWLISDYAGLQVQLGAPIEAANLLRGRLGSDPRCRDVWMRIAAIKLPAADAVAWLTEVEPLVPRDKAVERLTLADAWHAVSRRSQDPAHAAHAATLLKAVAGAPDSGSLSAGSMLVLASLQESHGEAAAAQQSYRNLLAAHPKSAIAQNNLAMILGSKRESLDEALALAQQAVEGAPPDRKAGIYDTLAFVQGQRGEYPAAIASIEQALTLKPNETKYQVRLASMLIENQQVDRARALLEELKSRAGTSPELQREIQSLQERVERSSSARAS